MAVNPGRLLWNCLFDSQLNTIIVPADHMQEHRSNDPSLLQYHFHQAPQQ